jgi:mannose-1-phosphate guanylyltransferase/mannose-6-phosphate isomerase
MLEETISRISGREDFAAPILISEEQHAAVLTELLDGIRVTPAAILLEPEGRNTAAAVAMAAHWVREQQDDGLMLVMPSDHVIADIDAFHRRMRDALGAAQDGLLVTFGVQPDHPATGYGYIESGSRLERHVNVYAVREFVEKPSLPVAQNYIAGGRHSWNAGIFLFSAASFLAELESLAPEIAGPIAFAMDGRTCDGVLVRPDSDHFQACANLSIDYAVMEKTQKAAVIPVDIGWSDVGSWDALWGVRAKDDMGNSIQGLAVVTDGSGNLIFVNGGPPVAAIGIENSVIISTPDAVLILPRHRAQDAKAIRDMRDKLAASSGV